LNKTTSNIGIIGGGMLGMTLAYRLNQKGYQITLYEAAPFLGGLAGAWQLEDIVWDRYYHVTLLSDLYLRNILSDLNLEKDMEWVETKTGFYVNGKLYSMSNSLEFLSFPPLSLLDKIRLGTNIFYASKIKNWRKLENILVEDWLKKWSGNNTFQKIWLPLLKAKLGDAYQKTSAAFIWATIQRMYAARRTGLKKEMFGYVPGGYTRILDSFSKKIENMGVKIKTNYIANHVEQHLNKKISVKFQNEQTGIFDNLILTIPAPIITKICPQLTETEKNKWNNIQYLGVICASVLLKKPLSRYYVTNITEDWVPFTGIIEMSALVDKGKYFNNKSLVYLPKYVSPQDAIFKTSDDDIRHNFINTLQRMHPHLNSDDIMTFKISRAKHVFALPTLNYSEKLPSMKTSIPGLFIINAAHIVNGTLNVNETIQLAERALNKYFG
jgi:protoporphyrinogen oxidase